MECPHCQIEIHEAWSGTPLNGGVPIGSIPAPPAVGSSAPMPLLNAGMSTRKQELTGVPPARVTTTFFVSYMACPACGKAIVRLYATHDDRKELNQPAWIVYPRHGATRRAAVEVPADLAEDFNEAALVLELSPKASAALSRRCLQAMLRDKGYAQHDLAKQIDALLAAKALPSGLAGNVDLIRNTGNFAAHPMKDTNSGTILPVEPHEAEWNLEVLEGLFDYFYVAPARDAARKVAFNAKLAAAGKPPLK